MINFLKNYKMLLSIILSSTILIIISVGFFSSSKPQEPVITSEWLKQSLLDINELSVLEYNYTNVGKFEDSNKLLGLTVPFSQKYFIVAYNGKIKAGVDLKQMEIDIQDKNININIGESKIISHEIFDDKLEIFDENNAIFNPIKIEDFTDFIKEEKDKLELEIIENGLLEEAKTKSIDFIQSFLSNILPDDYLVKVI